MVDLRNEAARRLGKTIAGRYAVIDIRGVGGMGAVYAARHIFTGETVALKILFADSSSSPDTLPRFVQEAQASAAIGHPNIVKVLDAGVDPLSGEMYLAMELLDGEDLADSLERGETTCITLLEAIVQALSALRAAHTRGFVHRDIKPENIFLVRTTDSSTQVKLLDFGVARRLGQNVTELTITGSVIGTVWYMSPEQARGERVDHRADLWAIGAVLFYALAGRPVFDGDNIQKALFALGTQQALSILTLRPDLPRSLASFVDRALRFKIEERWSTADEMCTTLEACIRELRTSGDFRVDSAIKRQRTRVAWNTTRVDPQAAPSTPRGKIIAGVIGLGSLIGLGAFSILTHTTSSATAHPSVQPQPPAPTVVPAPSLPVADAAIVQRLQPPPVLAAPDVPAAPSVDPAGAHGTLRHPPRPPRTPVGLQATPHSDPPRADPPHTDPPHVEHTPAGPVSPRVRDNY